TEKPPLQRSATVPLPWREDICESKCRGGKLTRGLAPVIIAIVLAISMSANLSAQTPITFTAAGPPTLTQVDVNTELSGLGVTYPFSAIINSPITALGINAFRGGTTNTTNRDYLVSVNAPNVITIGQRSFYQCSSLVSATFPLAKTIELEAFYQCSSLVSADFPNVETIGNSAFRYCTNLESADFQNAESIGNYAFANCSSLESADFPNATIISDSSFLTCTSLESADFQNATIIGAGAFRNCMSLEIADFPSVDTIGRYVFYGCTNLKSANFPLIDVGFSLETFYNCTKLESVYAPLVNFIGGSAFYQCNSLKSANFPLVETIGNNAFRFCYSLESANFPLATDIQDNAFYQCSSLVSITFGSTPPTFGSGAFNFVPNTCKVYVPHNTTDLDSALYVTRLNAIGFNGPVERLPATNTLTITATNGSVEVDGTTYTTTLTIDAGDNVLLESFPNSCYEFVNWTNGSGVVSPSPTLNVVVNSDTTFTANFTLTTHSLNVSSGANGGAIIGTSGTITSESGITCGTTKTITATPNSCYKLLKWTNSNGDSVTNVNPLDVDVIRDTTLIANFTLATHSLSVSSGGNGSVTGSDVGITCGTTKQITATPNACYQFAKWTNSNGDSVSNVSSLNISVIRDTTLTANFTLTTHSLVASSENTSQGSVTGSGAGITCGSSRTITATPNSCYQFAKWTNSNGDSVTNINPLDVNVIRDTTLIANFVADNITPRTFQVISDNPAMGTVDYMPNVGAKTGSYFCNTPITATATPEPKHRFIGWYENNVLVSNNSSYTFTISDNRTLVGRFEQKPPAHIKKVVVKKGKVRIKPIP
ncbi:MAG: leucine-rich repeat protein, partial [Bacteroidetes bacterium]|nr:leucine-rich repeat protein [Bacteroidota bacterium]